MEATWVDMIFDRDVSLVESFLTFCFLDLLTGDRCFLLEEPFGDLCILNFSDDWGLSSPPSHPK